VVDAQLEENPMPNVKDYPVDDPTGRPPLQVIGCLAGTFGNFVTITDPILSGFGIEEGFGVAIPDRALSQPAGKEAGRVVTLFAVHSLPALAGDGSSDSFGVVGSTGEGAAV
jgi:hypothetical protein